MPYGPILTAHRRNGTLLLFIGNAYGDTVYLRVTTDALTYYCELFPCSVPTSFVAVETLSMWCAHGGIPEILMSDHEAHFRNEVVKHLRVQLLVEQVSLRVYLVVPWNCRKSHLQVVRALLMENGLETHDMSYPLPALQANPNHTSVQSLGGSWLVKLFTWLPASSLLASVVGGDVAT